MGSIDVNIRGQPKRANSDIELPHKPLPAKQGLRFTRNFAIKRHPVHPWPACVALVFQLSRTRIRAAVEPASRRRVSAFDAPSGFFYETSFSILGRGARLRRGPSRSARPTR